MFLSGLFPPSFGLEKVIIEKEIKKLEELKKQLDEDNSDGHNDSEIREVSKKIKELKEKL
ncbi:MAG: hypothetical protein MJZ24_09570 [Paludibacteraceae bacterium]|nr:hypothetical protein [Paludibacteraceae bacterium]